MSSGLKNKFTELYHSYHPMVKQICLGFVRGDEDQANDISQDVFINVWNGLGNFRSKSGYKTWIYRITVNSCLNHIRREKTKEMPPQSQMMDDDASMYDKLYEAIGDLPELDRLLIMMFLDGLSHQEISEVTGLSSTNIRVKIHRIKNKIKNKIDHES